METRGALFVMLLAAAGCGGGSSAADPATTTIATTTTTTNVATTTTTVATTTTTVAQMTVPTTTAAATTTIDQLIRNRTVNVFLDDAKAVRDCIESSSFDCAAAQATYDRLYRAWSDATKIPGGDVRALVKKVNETWKAWDHCLIDAAASGGDRFTCSDQEAAVTQSVLDLYDSLR